MTLPKIGKARKKTMNSKSDERCSRAQIDPVGSAGKFATNINDTSGIGGKFAAGVVDTGGAP